MVGVNMEYQVYYIIQPVCEHVNCLNAQGMVSSIMTP